MGLGGGHALAALGLSRKRNFRQTQIDLLRELQDTQKRQTALETVPKTVTGS